jgi:hypothetical protein
MNSIILEPTKTIILAQLTILNSYGIYKTILKHFNSEDHFKNYILYIQNSGSKIIDSKILYN